MNEYFPTLWSHWCEVNKNNDNNNNNNDTHAVQGIACSKYCKRCELDKMTLPKKHSQLKNMHIFEP